MEHLKAASDDVLCGVLSSLLSCALSWQLCPFCVHDGSDRQYPEEAIFNPNVPASFLSNHS